MENVLILCMWYFDWLFKGTHIITFMIYVVWQDFIFPLYRKQYFSPSLLSLKLIRALFKLWNPHFHAFSACNFSVQTFFA